MFGKLRSFVSPVARFLNRAYVALVAMTLTLIGFAAMAQSNITGVVTSVDGYVTAAIAVGIAVLLFVLGRKVIRKLIALAGVLYLTANSAMAQSNISGVVTSVDGYVTAAIAVGIAVLLFVLGRKVIRKLI